jgi:hypothetical protein
MQKCKIVFLFICLTNIFYLSGYTQVKFITWTGYPSRVKQLDSLISMSATYALNPRDYNSKYLENILSNKYVIESSIDSAKADSIIHKIALHFFGELQYGNRTPQLAYQGVDFTFDKIKLNKLIEQYFNKNKLGDLTTYLNTQSKEITSLLKRVQDLLIQKENRLAENNKITIQQELTLIIKSVNEYRWLNTAKNKFDKIILVNLPAANLKMIENNKEVFTMKLIVGKLETPSVPLSSYVNQLVVNPYWNVPRNIAVREMLPNIITDPSYLNRNRLEVLNSAYKKINPNTVRWNTIDTNKFMYYIRQRTGCDNSLGVIKLDFDSPFGIYLHDSPEKQLFELNNRFFSHGCMRMEKPIQMAEYLLKNDKAALDSIDFKNCYKNPATINIPIKEKVVVLVWYNRVDFDRKGQIVIYKDVYNYN